MTFHVDRHDNTGRLPQGAIGASAVHRQWIGLSTTGDTVTVTSSPPPPHPSAPAFLETLAIEVGFLQRNLEIAEQFSVDDMAATFIRGFSHVVFTVGQILVFEYHGQNLKGIIKSVSVLELAAEQRRGGGGGGGLPGRTDSGIVMEKTEVTFLKDPVSKVKIKSSAKKAAPNAILAPNFKFEDMGIGGLDQEFSAIFRRAFASRVFPPGLVEKLGIQHVKGAWWLGDLPLCVLSDLGARYVRYPAAWTPWHWKDPSGKADWQDVECARAKDREWSRDSEQVRWSIRREHPKAFRGCGERGLIRFDLAFNAVY